MGTDLEYLIDNNDIAEIKFFSVTDYLNEDEISLMNLLNKQINECIKMGCDSSYLQKQLNIFIDSMHVKYSSMPIANVTINKSSK